VRIGEVEVSDCIPGPPTSSLAACPKAVEKAPVNISVMPTAATLAALKNFALLFIHISSRTERRLD